jgi:hypothetical protein
MMAGLAGVAAGEPNREFITEVELSFGGRNSTDKLAQDGNHHTLKLPADDLARLMLWMDTNAQFFSHEIDVQGQAEGKVVYPAFNWPHIREEPYFFTWVDSRDALVGVVAAGPSPIMLPCPSFSPVGT